MLTIRRDPGFVTTPAITVLEDISYVEWYSKGVNTAFSEIFWPSTIYMPSEGSLWEVISFNQLLYSNSLDLALYILTGSPPLCIAQVLFQ